MRARELALEAVRWGVALALGLGASVVAGGGLFASIGRDDLRLGPLALLAAPVAVAAFVAGILFSERRRARVVAGLLPAAGSAVVGAIALAAWLHDGLGSARLMGFAALGLLAHPGLAIGAGWLGARLGRRLRAAARG